MKRIVQILLLAFAAIAPVFGQAPAKEPKAGSDEQTITKMETDWGMALTKRDMATIDRMEATDYMFTAPDGSLSNKTESDAMFKSGDMMIESFKIDDLKVRINGDTAVVHGLETEKSSYKGTDTSGQYRFTDVFVKRNGTWRALTTHVSKVEKH
jgi:ketosteroid isomerase-like protein